MRHFPALALLVAGLGPVVLAATAAPLLELPAGYWDQARCDAILDATMKIRLAPDLTGLPAGERRAVAKLLQVGEIFESLYQAQRHRQAQPSFAALSALDRTSGHAAATTALLTLFRLNQGPIASTLDNQRVAFVPVDPEAAGKNVYPWGVSKPELESHLARHPAERAALLDPRSVVRRADAASLDLDLAALARHPVLEALHPGLRRQLQQRPHAGFYAVPYSVAWADELVRASGLLQEAATLAQADDAAFARYLRNRARDLLSDDYESGDAAWVTSRFADLNAQIGAYETYDDGLYGTKAFFGFSLLLRDAQSSDALARATTSLQQFEDAIPSPRHKRVRADIPVAVYDVVADFGQARGTNTATILPNDPDLARRYGRTILLRGNILKDATIFESQRQGWQAVVAPAHAGELRPDGDLYRTLWHEIGHYLGVDADRQGRDLDTALLDDAGALEEMKADLVSLFVAPLLEQSGYYDAARLRGVYASGIRRVLNPVRPRRDQPYQTMQLVQFNWFLEQGLLSIAEDSSEPTLRIHYDRYPAAVRSLLEAVLALQDAGDKPAADQFLDRYTRWLPELHERLAARIRAGQSQRFRLVHYAALGE